MNTLKNRKIFQQLLASINNQASNKLLKQTIYYAIYGSIQDKNSQYAKLTIFNLKCFPAYFLLT